MRIFLDVDDLDDIDNLEHHIKETQSVLIFISSGYFLSRNCKREIQAAKDMAKPLVLVHEAELK